MNGRTLPGVRRGARTHALMQTFKSEGQTREKMLADELKENVSFLGRLGEKRLCSVLLSVVRPGVSCSNSGNATKTQEFPGKSLQNEVKTLRSGQVCAQPRICPMTWVSLVHSCRGQRSKEFLIRSIFMA